MPAKPMQEQTTQEQSKQEQSTQDMPMRRQLGTCYYPEHWPSNRWADDAKRMVDLGITWVRLGEFAWGVLEPKPDNLCWSWLDDAIGTLADAGLKLILGTPTATPPRWMLDKYPDMLALDANGRQRKFGSRRHYCFSHAGYRLESVRIASLMAQRYGNHFAIQAWQIDNEYGCHDTTYSYSHCARQAFCQWLQQRYHTIDNLNQAWGNVFWSMQYQSFEQVDLPNLTVTEANPSHQLDFMRFSSDQVVAFNLAQVNAIKQHSNAPVSHNYMGRVTDFDHFKVSDSLDFVTWDSYPLGFLEDRVGASSDDQVRYAQQGDCDFQAFHHDLYRGMGKNQRWWVMEQQPGAVNWAPYNPAPKQGMVRLWSWEAFAHGAEAVCYFRFRQVHFAQEQMHAGLLNPDNSPSPAWQEVQQLSKELNTIHPIDSRYVASPQAPVALVFDYEAEMAWQAQPPVQGKDYFDLVFNWYQALRKLGLSIDIVNLDRHDLSGYQLVLVPGFMPMTEPQKTRLKNLSAHVLLGPKTAAKTINMHIPNNLPPNFPGLDIKVRQCQSLRPGITQTITLAQETATLSAPQKALKKTLKKAQDGRVIHYIETLQTPHNVLLSTHDNQPLLVHKETRYYLGAWLDQTALIAVIESLCNLANIPVLLMPEGVRRRDTGHERFWFNYDNQAHTVDGLHIAPAEVMRHQR